MKKLTKNQKIYVAALSVGLIALLFDRVLFSPGSATATETAEFHPGASPVARATDAAARIPELIASVQTPETTLASRFAEVAQAHDLDRANIRDAFRAPAAWFPDRPLAVVPVEDLETAERFRRSHKLNAVMANAKGGYAIVDNRSLRVGQEIDGFRLVEVRPRSIVLERAGARVELALPDGD